tara:strand:- start:255979 stop:257769 length:1791 start_codon:yes stop_codon:yes gene_type:complete
MAISSTQLARVHTQLNQIMKQINAGNLQSAGTAITQLVRKYPALGETNHVASGYFTQIKEQDRAIYYAQRALKADPTNPGYLVALGVLLVQINNHETAIGHLEQALKIDPKTPQAKGVLAVSYTQLGKVAKARAMFNQAIADSPDDHESAMNLALLESDIGNANKAVEMMQRLITRFPDNPVLHDSLCMFATYDDQLSPSEVFDIHKKFGNCIQSRVRAPKSYANDPDPNRKVKLGFISPDFIQHSIVYFLEPIFKNIDRTKFEICMYFTATRADETTKTLESQADIWRHCSAGMAQAHKQVVQDQVDVLFELTGHFASNLLPIFAAKPSPVSISTIGYANTTGLDTVDVRIIDSITDPSPQADTLATEKLIRIDNCFLCYAPPANAPAVEQSLPDRPFTFGSFNDLRKISPSTLNTWAEILIANPSAVLMLKSSRFGDHEVCEEFATRFKDRGIEPSRLILKGRTQTLQEHLAMYNQIDCALDTFPYTGTTTTCESLWMGVPVITLTGNSHAGRVGASLLHAVGLDDLVTIEHQAYIDCATSKAKQGSPSTKDRIALRTQMQISPLLDAPTYTKNFESIIHDLWSSWCQQQGASK